MYGIIEGIDDTIIFGSPDAAQIEDEFHAAVEDYLEFCKDYGKDPQKAYNGIFNVRIQSALHREAVFYASLNGLKLNQYVENAISEMVDKDKNKEIYGESVAPVYKEDRTGHCGDAAFPIPMRGCLTDA